MPTFSVIIPCYNCASTLKATVGSLQAQSFSDWEAICVDDGSSDDTLHVLESYMAEDARIRVIRQDNTGPSRARNAGAAAARGKFVAFLDADDLWSPKKLESTLATFNAHPDAQAVFGRIAFFKDRSAHPATFSSVEDGVAVLSDFTGENPVCTLSNLTVGRTAFLATGGFDETMRYSEDLEWLIRVVAGGMTIASTSDLHVSYRTSAQGLSSDLPAMHRGWKRALTSAGPTLSKRQALVAEAIHLRYLARRALRTGAPAHIALSFALRGVQLSPKAFLSDRHRGPMTLLGCLLSPVIPPALRTRIFA